MTEELLVNLGELPNLGILTCKVPTEILAKLNERINTLVSTEFKDTTDHRKYLLGHLKQEYRLDECIPDLEPFIIHLAEIYNSRWDYLQTIDFADGQFRLKLSNLWINFQKKHDFNPPHGHTGVFSFALWMRIPYDLKEEEAVYPEVSGGPPRTSKFTFHYSNILGQQSHYVMPVDKSYEGVICLFPSDLCHSVNPFYTSDDYRISISGNLKYGPTE